MMVKAVIALFLILLGTAGAEAQKSTIKEDIAGAWALVAVSAELSDGSKSEPFGPNPKGIIIFAPDGYFSLFQSRTELPKIAANDRSKATLEEPTGVVAGSIAYYGTYSVNEAESSLSVQLEGSTYSNLLGAPQKRLISALTSEELRFANPRTPSGMILQTVWKRVPAK